MSVALFGGAFDPPHNGHVELLAAAKAGFDIKRATVVVAAAPGHKDVATPAGDRLALAKLAFPGDDVILDDHARTVDLLRAHPEWRDPLFLIGADEFAGFLSWKEPAEVLRRARLGVATRPGFGFESLAPVLGALGKADRITFFEIEPLPIASRDLRALLEADEDVSAHIPASVATEIDRRGLYGRHQGYTR
jgi:nicotinate-nucleotide adenylyltransferase